MHIEPALTPTAAFWLDMLQQFDPRHEGPHWERSLRDMIEPVIRTDEQLLNLVKEGIIIQQVLLELVTRRGVSRVNVEIELTSLLTPES